MLSAKGVRGNIPFDASFPSLERLIDWRFIAKSYTKVGTFTTYPDAMQSSNCGL